MQIPSLKKIAKNFGTFVYKHFEQDSGNMILITSIIAIGLSAVAQTAAVMVNKKYTVSQKAFMIPQELTEGLMTMLSLFVVAKPLQKFAGKLTKTGKITTNEIKTYLIDNNIIDKCGKFNFDIKSNITSKINDLKKSNKYLQATNDEKQNILRYHNDILQKYEVNADATSAIATTAGSLISTAFISPIIRNISASHYQKVNMDIYENVKNKKQNHPYSSNYMLNINYNNPNLKI